MLKLSEIIKNSDKYFAIVNQQTFYLQKFFKNYFIFDDKVLMKNLWETTESLYFLNIEILFLKLKNLRERLYVNEIQSIKKKHFNNTIFVTPIFFKNINTFIDDITNHSFLVNVVSENFIHLHKLHCTFKNKNSILLTIFQYFSFNLKDLYYFIIYNNYYIKIQNYKNLNKTFNSFSDAINFLLQEKNELKINKINDFLLYIKNNNYKEKKFNNIYDTYSYWQIYFKEETVKYCECLYISHKEIDNYSHLNPINLNIKPINHLYANHTKVTNRHLTIELSNYETVTNYKKFYIEKILKFPIHKEDNGRKIKLKSLMFNNKIKTFNINY